MPTKLKLIGITILVLAVIFGVIYGIFSIKRSMHYSFSYKGKVQEQICDSVKHEYLTIDCK